MPTMQYLSPWEQTYSFQVEKDFVGTDTGYHVQRSDFQENEIVVAELTRRLWRFELGYWEYFIRVLCKEGSLKFTDYFADGQGLRQIEIRLIDGSYDVQSDDSRKFTINCSAEVINARLPV